jgi:hypothetical protein
MPALFRQAGFVGGELSPDLYGASGLDVYDAGARRLRNFIVSPLGSAVSRPGTRYVATIKDWTNPARLIPFIFSNGQTYVIEVGDQYLRFYSSGSRIETSPGVAYEVATTYPLSEVSRLKFAQAGDTLLIAHPNRALQGLQRITSTTFSLATYSIGSPTISRPQSLVTGTGSGALTIDTTGDANHAVKTWDWVVTAVNADGEESQVSNTATISAVARYPDRPSIPLSWSPPASGTPVYYKVYAGRDGVYGFVSTADVGICGYKDPGTAPDFTKQPPVLSNPFGSSSNRPSAVAFFQQRLIAANTGNRPAGIWGSRTGAYHDFDAKAVLTDSDSFNFNLAATRFEEVRSLVSLRKLLAFTGSAAWVIGGGQDGAIGPASIDARPEVGFGASWLDPVQVGHDVLFVRDTGNAVHDLAFDFTSDSYTAPDLSLLVRHLLDGHSIVDIAYARNPFSVVWIVRDDGVLLSLTFVKDQKVVAWAWHDTQGAVENVCVVPEGTEDAVYLIVKRTNAGGDTRFVERMATRLIDDLRYAVTLDASFEFDGHGDGSTLHFAATSGDLYTAGSTIDVTVTSGAFRFSSGDVGRLILLGPDDDTPRHLTITAYTSSTHVTAEATEPVFLSGSGLVSYSTIDWALAASTLSGMTDMEGMSVMVLGDGDPQGPYTVSGGAITIDTPVVVAQVGLSFTPELELLDLAPKQVELRARQKRVTAVHFEVKEARGLWVGDSADSTLEEWVQREVSDSYGAMSPATTLATVYPDAAWNQAGRAFLQQQDPLPVTVLAVTREVDIGS